MQIELTNRELRNFLSGQWRQEMFCSAILSIDPAFEKISPVKPDGGPDGGRDITCTYCGAQAVAGVSFVASSNDSQSERRQILKKVKADLVTARSANSAADVFICFTNTTFTPKGRDEINGAAIELGFNEILIYDRNRLAQMLCNTSYMHIRHEYLKIKMTEDEQSAFFASWGDQLSRSFAAGFARLETLNRLSSWKREPLTEITLLANLWGTEFPPSSSILVSIAGMVRGRGEFMVIFSLRSGPTAGSKIHGSIVFSSPHDQFLPEAYVCHPVDDKVLSTAHLNKLNCHVTDLRPIDFENALISIHVSEALIDRKMSFDVSLGEHDLIGCHLITQGHRSKDLFDFVIFDDILKNESLTDDVFELLSMAHYKVVETSIEM